MSHVAMIGVNVVGNASGVFLPDAGATQVFNLASFAASDSRITTNSTQATGVVLPGTVLALINGTGTHQATGAFWNAAQLNIQSFTTNFEFQMTAGQRPSAFTGVISGTTLTVSGISQGTLQVGTYIGGNSNITAGTKITALGTGTGGNGTYTLNNSQTVASEAMTGGSNGAISFIVQNSTATTQSGGFGGFGVNFQGDANVAGYGGLAHLGLPQAPCLNSIGLVFEWYISQGTDAQWNAAPNFFALNVNGGPDSAIIPHLDLSAVGISIHNGNVLSCTLVYDSTLLTMTLLDTTTNAQVRYSWPINIPACTQQNTAWVGFGAGSLVPVPVNVLNWSYATGYNARLATPTFNIAAGHYTSTQTVTISGPSGASIYYTTNGLQPTSSSTLYSSPITVSSSEFVQAVAIQSGFTDSLIASANYVIQASGPTINFPSGFASSAGLIIPVGTAQLSGSALQLTDSLGGGGEAGGMWYAAPVSVSSFSTTFTMSAPSGSTAGMAFVFQNQNQSASTGYVPAAPGSAPNGYGSGQLTVSGGPLCIGPLNTGLGVGAAQSPNTNGDGNGYVGMYSSVALALSVSANTVGVYLNGAYPSGSSISLTGAALNSGHPLTVALSYSGTTLSLLITDTVNSNTFSHNFTVDIPGTVGASTAYVGITAGNFNNGVQSVTNWTGF